MDSEFQFHLQSQINDYVEQGLSRENAELRARREFGALELAKEECRDERPFERIDRFLREVRYAFRSLRKSPGFATAAILTLALGIGANTAIFSVLYGVALAPLPYRDANRLIFMALYNPAIKSPWYISYPDFLDWQRTAHSLEQIAAFTPQGFNLTSPGTPAHVAGKEVSSNFFSTLGVKLALGRDFSPKEDHHGGMPAAVISNRFWRDRFAGNPSALGKPITLDGIDYTIIGILQPRFRLDNQQADVYTPLGGGDPVQRNDRTIHNVVCIARLQPNVSIGQAQAEMNAVQEHIDDLNPASERGLETLLIPLKQFLVGDIGGTLSLLLGAVGLVLLIACANVANLLLARSATRTREFAVRQALGARRMQIVRQLLIESLLLSSIGGTLGLALARWGPNAVLAVIPERLPRIENIGMNTSVLLFAFGISMTAGVVFGLLPALRSSNTDLQGGLKEGSRGSTSSHHRTQRVLVVAQIALALVLLTGGGLLLRTIHNLWAVNPGFNAQHVLTFQVGLSPSVTQTGQATKAAYQQLMERIRQTPGVQAAGMTALVPLGQHNNQGPFWVGSRQPAVSLAQIPRAEYYWTGPDYLSTMKIPLLRGRFLTRADTDKSERVVVIDTRLARTYFPGGDPVGQTITVHLWGTARVIGVVGHVQHSGLDGSDSTYEKPQIYASFYQLSDQWVPVFSRGLTIAVRTPLDTSAIMPAIKRTVSGASDSQPVYNVQTMQELFSASMTPQRLSMILLGAFAGLALLLASVGIYGVISYSMAQRVKEIGIRMALGAEKRDVLRMVLGQGLRLALTGIAVGAVAAFILTRALSSFSRLLYGVRASDPWTFLAVSLVLLLAALLACYLPARRAAQLDPMMALRHE